MRMKSKARGLSVAGVVCTALAVQGCTTTGPNGERVRSTAIDKAIAECIGGMVVSTAAGALIGAAFGGNAGAERGAIIGAAAGAGRCVVLIELAAQEDKRQVYEAQLNALKVDRTTTSSITTQKGKKATVRTKVTEAPLPPPKKVTVAAAPAPQAPSVPQTSTETAAASAPAAPQATNTGTGPLLASSYVEERQDYTACRFTELLVDIDGQSADGGKQKWCKGGDGSWEPVAS